MFTNRGNTCYIIPRKFVDENLPFNSFWNDLSGLITIKDEKFYEELNNTDEINKIMKDYISLSEDVFDELSKIILDHFSKIYKIDIHN